MSYMNACTSCGKFVNVERLSDRPTCSSCENKNTPRAVGSARFMNACSWCGKFVSVGRLSDRPTCSSCSSRRR